VAVRRAVAKPTRRSHGPYPQISFNWHGKSTTPSVRANEVDEVRQQLKNYHHLRDLVDEWISLALELSRLRLRERRKVADAQKNGRKNAKTQQNRKRRAEK
jgi:UDP-2,3-diacylglucosamine pyrophosphatase LpxH